MTESEYDEGIEKHVTVCLSCGVVAEHETRLDGPCRCPVCNSNRCYGMGHLFDKGQVRLTELPIVENPFAGEMLLETKAELEFEEVKTLLDEKIEQYRRDWGAEAKPRRKELED